MLSNRLFNLLIILSTFTFAAPTWALDLDWGGQFRTESHFLLNYTGDTGNRLPDANRVNGNGYYIPGGGSKDAFFQTLFLRLRPTVIVNDNVYIKSEWWLGDPVFTYFGSGTPHTLDQRQFYSSSSRGLPITAQRVWGEFVTDVGTVQVGRLPLHWGLGIVWNQGDGLRDRYMTTADAARIVSKFGSFTVAPTLLRYSIGNNVAGNCVVGASGSLCTPVKGAGGLTDFSFLLMYDNLDEDFSLGLNFLRRLAGSAQDSVSGYAGANGGVEGANFNLWDIYARKRWGRFSIAGELPIAQGTVSGMRYTGLAGVIESKLQVANPVELQLKAGFVSGQPSIPGASTETFRAFYLHPAYKVGLIMFNYALHRFAGPNTDNNPETQATALRSPFDNPVTNSLYLSAGGEFKYEKFRFGTNWLFARAHQVAKVDSGSFYNSWDRRFVTKDPNAGGQGSFLGWEMDYYAAFHWDDHLEARLDTGVYFPGSYYQFSNTSTNNTTNPIFALNLGVGVKF